MSIDTSNADFGAYDDVFGGPPRLMLSSRTHTPSPIVDRAGTMAAAAQLVNASSISLLELPVFGDDSFRTSSRSTAVASDNTFGGRASSRSGEDVFSGTFSNGGVWLKSTSRSSTQNLSPVPSFALCNDWCSQDDALPVFGSVEPANPRWANPKVLPRSYYSSIDGFPQDAIDIGCNELNHGLSTPPSPRHISIDDHVRQPGRLFSGASRTRALGNVTKGNPDDAIRRSFHGKNLVSHQLYDADFNVHQGPGSSLYDNLIRSGMTDNFQATFSWVEKHHLLGNHPEPDFPSSSSQTDEQMLQDDFIETRTDQLVDCLTLKSDKGVPEKDCIAIDDAHLAMQTSSELLPVRSPPTPPAQHEMRSWRNWESKISVQQSFSERKSHSVASGPIVMDDSRQHESATWLREKVDVFPYSPSKWQDRIPFGTRSMDGSLGELTESKLWGKDKLQSASKVVQLEQGELETKLVGTPVRKDERYRKLEFDQGQLQVQEGIEKERQWRGCSRERTSPSEKEVQTGIAVEAATEEALEMTDYIAMNCCIVSKGFAAGRHAGTQQLVDILDEISNAETGRLSTAVLTGFGEPFAGNTTIKQKHSRAASEAYSVRSQDNAESITAVDKHLLQEFNNNGKFCGDISRFFRRESIHRPCLQAHVQDMEQHTNYQNDKGRGDVEESELEIPRNIKSSWEYQLRGQGCMINALEEKKQIDKEICLQQEQNDVLCPDDQWQPIPLTELIEGPSVQKAYQKASLLTHPDKMQRKHTSIQQKYVTHRVFNILQESWKILNARRRCCYAGNF